MKKRHRILLLFLIASTIILTGCSGAPSISSIQNALDPTTATDKLITVSVTFEGETSDVDGLYTGDLKNGLADGVGSFVVDSDEEITLSYKGEFSGGQINGEGVLKITIDSSTELRYEGTFVNGAIDGHGSTIAISDGETLVRSGTYTRGVYTPTVGEKYNYLGQMDLYGVFGLSDSVISYIDAHPEYFPQADKPDAEAAVLRDFEYRQFTKTRKQDTIGLIKLELYAAQVYEDEFEELNDTVTYLLAADADENLYTLYFLNSVEIYDGDVFTAYALPVATTSYENVSGGTTNAIVLIGSYLDVTG